MTNQLRYTIAVLFLVFLTKMQAQEAKEDLSWLAAIPRPVMELDMMKATWDSAASSLVFTDIVVDWVDATDADVEGHLIRKALNCMPLGNLASGDGDSVTAVHAGAKIEIQLDGGTIKVYRIGVPLVHPSGQVVSPPFNGSITLMITAAKLIDTAYTVEHTISRRVTLEDFANSP